MAQVQFNLLPDSKLKYDRTQKTRQFITAIAVLVSGVALAIFLLLFISIDVVQKREMSNSSKSLNSANTSLQNIPNLAQVITVQNQLQTLVGLHQNKHITSRIFTYLSQLTPASVSISELDMNTAGNSMTIVGNADTQATVNAFIDTLKATTYKVGSNDSAHPAFSSVTESSFAINSTNVSYTLNLQFDPQLFSNDLLDAQGKPQSPQLTVPKQTTSGGNIFQAQSGG